MPGMAQRPVMAALSLPALSMSETEKVFIRLSAANQRPGETCTGQSEERMDEEPPFTRLQQTFKPKSASSSCHCGHNYLETDDKSLGNNLTRIKSSSRDSLAPATDHSDVSMDQYLPEILILDEIQTNRNECPELFFAHQKVGPLPFKSFELMNCWCILHKTQLNSLISFSFDVVRLESVQILWALSRVRRLVTTCQNLVQSSSRKRWRQLTENGPGANHQQENSWRTFPETIE